MSQKIGRKLYTAREAAQLLGVSRSTIYELIARGELPAARIGRRVMIRTAVLHDILGEPPPPPEDLA